MCVYIWFMYILHIPTHNRTINTCQNHVKHVEAVLESKTSLMSSTLLARLGQSFFQLRFPLSLCCDDRMGGSLVTTKLGCLFGSFFSFLLFCLNMKLLKMLEDPFSDGTRKISRQGGVASKCNGDRKDHESVSANKQLNARVRVTLISFTWPTWLYERFWCVSHQCLQCLFQHVLFLPSTFRCCFCRLGRCSSLETWVKIKVASVIELKESDMLFGMVRGWLMIYGINKHNKSGSFQQLPSHLVGCCCSSAEAVLKPFNLLTTDLTGIFDVDLHGRPAFAFFFLLFLPSP